MHPDAILGGLFGLLIGDAVGVPYEFHHPNQLPALEELDMEPPKWFRRAHPTAPSGAWSDDGSQALCLLASLLERGRFEAQDFGARLVRWYREGYMAVDGIVFDVGIQTREAILAIESGVPASQAGPKGEHQNGNGSLMRVLPLALWHRGTDDELMSAAMLQSLVTHGHPRAQACCAVYCLWARETLNGTLDAWGEALEKALELARHYDPAIRREIRDLLCEPGGNGSGYVVDSLNSARLALQESSYERVVQRAVSLGNDTDTTAAIAGGIAGIRHGFYGIPARWRELLAGQGIAFTIAEKLLKARN